jgi:hypothetical protein
MTTKTIETAESIATRLFIYVVLGTVGFFTAMALLFLLMKV